MCITGANRGSVSGAWVRAGSRLVLLLLAVLTMVAAGASRPLLATAQTARSFVWDRVDVTVSLQADSTLHVTERDRALFSGGPFRTGYRDIPLTRIERIDHIRVASVTEAGLEPFSYVWPDSFSKDVPNTFTTRTSGTLLHIEWSFPATTSQSRTFQLDYDAHGALRVYPDYDPPYQQLSWIGVDRALTHDAPVHTATLTFVLPRRVDPEQTHVVGPGGSASGEYFTSGQTWTWVASNLHPGDSLEATLQFPPLVKAKKPAWQDASDSREQMLRSQPQLTLVFLGLALIIAIGGGLAVLAAWWTRGRDPKIGPVAEFVPAPPADLPPAVVGALVDEMVDKRDIVATLVDLGRRGVLRIEPTHRSGITWKRSTEDFTLTFLQANVSLTPFEHALLATFFGQPFMGKSVALSAVKRPSRQASADLQNILYDDLVRRGFFPTRPSRTRKAWSWVGVTLIAIVYVALRLGLGNPLNVVPTAWMPVAAFLAVGFLALFAARIMPRKTVAGVEAAAKWRTFKKYLEHIDRFEQLDAAQDLFERYLPYAIAFGIDRTWIERFSHFETPAPRWYGVPDGFFPLSSGAGGQPGGPTPATGVGSSAVPDLQSLSGEAQFSLQAASNSLFDLFNSAEAKFAVKGGGSAIGGGGFGGGGFGGGGGGGGGFR